MDKFAYIMTNVKRFEQTKDCIISLSKHCKNSKIYLADQDKPSKKKNEFYKKYNVKYYYVPFDIGVGIIRNKLVEQVKEPYIMWGDNDFVFDKENNINLAISLLKERKDVDVVGGTLLKNNKRQQFERILVYEKKYGLFIHVPLHLCNNKTYFINDNPYYKCDLTWNFAITRKSLFNNPKIKWDEKMKVIGLHVDFFLTLKEQKCSVVYLPKMTAHHNHIIPEDYYKLRYRKESGRKRFINKRNLKTKFNIRGKSKCQIKKFQY